MNWIGIGAAAALLAVSGHAQNTQPAPVPVKPKSTVAPGDANAEKTPAQATQSGQANGAKNSGHASETVEYKDPEDMTTRYRPGNNKTTTVQTTTTQSATSADAAKPRGDKKDVGFPACDGASKDAAKCAPAHPGTQDTTHVNKVDSFTVKQ